MLAESHWKHSYMTEFKLEENCILQVSDTGCRGKNYSMAIFTFSALNNNQTFNFTAYFMTKLLKKVFCFCVKTCVFVYSTDMMASDVS